jgi:F0F1-type ATP synthase membrane subunit b/b'
MRRGKEAEEGRRDVGEGCGGAGRATLRMSTSDLLEIEEYTLPRKLVRWKGHAMNCLNCQTTNPEENRYCGKCGAELGSTLDETVRQKGFRDRQATEMEITEAVSERLFKWAKWLGAVTTVFAVLFGVLLGSTYRDIRTAVRNAKADMQTTVRAGKKEVEAARQETVAVAQETKAVKQEVQQIRSDAERFKRVNADIDTLQKRITSVQEKVVDLGHQTLKAETFETTGKGPMVFSSPEVGCPAFIDPTKKVALCIQAGNPPSVAVVTSAGIMPAASPSGFQETSTTVKPPCTTKTRGMFYVEKGNGNVADTPFLCARHSNNTYGWTPLAAIP